TNPSFGKNCQRTFYFNDHLGLNIEIGGFVSFVTVTQQQKAEGGSITYLGVPKQQYNNYHVYPRNLSFFPAASTFRINLFYRIHTKQ
ncbi:MAG: hypothetical protein GY810_20405, partial [Aureispira sp.]|nr:hypothetical protein [Aureispira sp.]